MTTPSPLDRMLDDLIEGRWILTLEDTKDGGTEIVAYRPPGWAGPDPHERLAAPDHEQMRAVLIRRQEADRTGPSTPLETEDHVATTTLTRPTPHAPTAAACGMCNGQGGSWVTNDGGTPGKNIREWVPCSGCNGSGKK